MDSQQSSGQSQSSRNVQGNVASQAERVPPASRTSHTFETAGAGPSGTSAPPGQAEGPQGSRHPVISSPTTGSKLPPNFPYKDPVGDQGVIRCFDICCRMKFDCLWMYRHHWAQEHKNNKSAVMCPYGTCRTILRGGHTPLMEHLFAVHSLRWLCEGEQKCILDLPGNEEVPCYAEFCLAGDLRLRPPLLVEHLLESHKHDQNVPEPLVDPMWDVRGDLTQEEMADDGMWEAAIDQMCLPMDIDMGFEDPELQQPPPGQ